MPIRGYSKILLNSGELSDNKTWRQVGEGCESGYGGLIGEENHTVITAICRKAPRERPATNVLPLQARIRSKGKGDMNGGFFSIRTKGFREEVILRKCRGKAAGLRQKHAHRFSRRSRRRAAIVSGGMSPRIFAHRAFFTSPSRKSIEWSSKSSAYCPSL